jgi:hypothetical protein
MLNIATPPMMSLKAHEMSNWQKGEVKSGMGVLHSRMMEEAIMSCSASLNVEKIIPVEAGKFNEE